MHCRCRCASSRSPYPIRYIRGNPHRAFSMVETAFSVLLVGGLLVTSLNTLSASASAQKGLADRGRGQKLAMDLMAEVLRTNYEDPDGSPAFGPETGESTLTRANFDDVDDFRGHSESTCTYKNGSTVAGFTRWRRTVAVDRVLASDLLQTSLVETGVKRITVVALYNNVPVSTLTTVVTKERPRMILVAE